MIFYIENPKESTKKLVELISKHNKIAIQKSVVFIYTVVMNHLNEENNSIDNSIKKNKLLRNKFNKISAGLPGCPGVKTPHFLCKGFAFDPWLGNLRSCMSWGEAKIN